MSMYMDMNVDRDMDIEMDMKMDTDMNLNTATFSFKTVYLEVKFYIKILNFKCQSYKAIMR